uniref:Ferredoxin n=1 Tax=Desulfobacca acetoxidans TaxID=60893 RepID=A0A7C5ALJ4_9BACT
MTLTDQVPEIDDEACIGCGVCEALCPEVFSFNPSIGFALVVNPEGADPAKISEACQACPAHCIHCSQVLEEEGGNAQKNTGN